MHIGHTIVNLKNEELIIMRKKEKAQREAFEGRESAHNGIHDNHNLTCPCKKDLVPLIVKMLPKIPIPYCAS